MEFLTLHELSRELNKPERQLRHKFKNLLKQNTLVEGEDFIRDGYIDDQHFIFKINPVRFVALTQLNPVPLPDATGYEVDNKLDNNSNQVDTKSVNNVVTNPPEVGTTVDTQQRNSKENFVQESTPNSMTTDFIELMKEQLREKDRQLKEKDDQLKSKDELLKLAQESSKEKDNAQILALSEIIRLNKKILPPAPGEEAIEVDASGYQAMNDIDTNFGTSGYHGGTSDHE